MFRAFKEKYPAVTYELYAGNADYTNERIEKGLSDIALFLEPVDIDRYDFIRLGVKERWAVLLPAEDPLVQKGFVTAADLVGKELLFPARLKVQNELVSWFGDYFPQVRVPYTCNMSTNASIMVRNGLGYAFHIEGSRPFWTAHRSVRCRCILNLLLLQCWPGKTTAFQCNDDEIY